MAPNELARHEVYLFVCFHFLSSLPFRDRSSCMYNHFFVPSPLRLLYHMSLSPHAAKYPYRGRHLSAYNIPVMLTSTTFSTDVSDLGFKVIGTFPNWPIFFPLLTAPPSFCSFASQYCFKGRSIQPPSAGTWVQAGHRINNWQNERQISSLIIFL